MSKITYIHDSRLSSDLKRVRAGSIQQFFKPENRTFTPDFELTPPENHLYALLMDGFWYWVNGCDICNNAPEPFGSYIRCEEHNICCICGTKRVDIKGSVCGDVRGFMCGSCYNVEKAIAKKKALASIKEGDEYNERDYFGLNEIICPYCGSVESDGIDYEESNRLKMACETCENTYYVTAEHSVTYSTERE